ncbi:DUF1016 N-terminal domain-containing protein [Erysipelatoclostridium sp. An15]|nr:DUF1016 N-terminal domain-containing protein [Erysipelatoclostridium sp. An15]
MENNLLNNEALVNEIASIITNARNNVAKQVNNELLNAYWNIGRVIVEDELKNNRGEYGKKQLLAISKNLTNKFGKGFSQSNLYNMKMFYTKYPIFQSVTGKLSWTHYCELLYISDDDKRSFYEKEAINANWSVRELKRQISSSLFERLLLSNGETNKKKVLELALK